MKFTSIIIFLGSAASLVSAQAACTSAVAAVPTCGMPCIISAASAVGCASTNYPCDCVPATFTSIQNAAAPCVISKCGAATAVALLASVSKVCSACG